MDGGCGESMSVENNLKHSVNLKCNLAVLTAQTIIVQWFAFFKSTLCSSVQLWVFVRSCNVTSMYRIKRSDSLVDDWKYMHLLVHEL